MSNPYAALLRLLPQRPLQVGEVVVAMAGDTAVVQLDGGATITARGSASVGQRVFVRDGAIEGIAPSLSLVEIEV